MLNERNYTIVIDKSGSMATKDQENGKSRWSSVKESTLALASKCEELDPDGITVYTFSNRFKRYENVTSRVVEQIFQENDPMGSTNLTDVLQDAINAHFRSGKPETILVITDGEPNDRKSVFEVIIQATQKMNDDNELAISFLQVGNDSQATQFLKALDDQLHSVGAKYDIVDTITVQDMEDMTLQEMLMSAVFD